jgi:hypothetical protein
MEILSVCGKRKGMRSQVAAGFFLFLMCVFTSSAGELICGTTHLKLDCESTNAGSGKNCKKTALLFEFNQNGKERVVTVRRTSKSKLHVKKTPLEATCLQNTKGESYVLVQFGDGPLDCVSCSLFDLYGADGIPLTTLGRNLDQEVRSRELIHRLAGAPKIRIAQ